MKKYGLAILASGNGSNAEEIIRYFSNHPEIEVKVVFSNNPQAMVLERAKRLGIPAVVFSRTEFADEQTMLHTLTGAGVTHIVLAGFLWLIPEYLIKAYPDRIINIHPALLPAFGGKGMYGLKVHEAVRLAKEKESGITIHLVNEHYDEGKILFQTRCRLDEGCTAEDIARKVHTLEHAHYPAVIEKWVLGVEKEITS